jgi:hypothetical protein
METRSACPEQEERERGREGEGERQLSPNAWLSFPHSIFDKEHDSHKEIILIIGNFSIRKKRNRTPDTSRHEYSRMPLQKVLSSYTAW